MRFLNTLCDVVGRSIAWLTGLMALLTLIIVMLRYGFDIGAIGMQEAVMYLHGLVFMLGIPYGLQNDSHVRVDILYSRLPSDKREWINLVGHGLFLLPFSLLIFFTSLPYVRASWRVLEGSQEVGGIPALFLLKTLIPVAALLMILQGLAEIGRCIGILRNKNNSSSHLPPNSGAAVV